MKPDRVKLSRWLCASALHLTKAPAIGGTRAWQPWEFEERVTVRPARLAAVLLIIVLAPGVSAALRSPTRSSANLLLRPNVRTGQTIAWDLRVPEPEDLVLPPDLRWRSDIFTCTVLKGSSDDFTVSRRIKVYMPADRPYEVGDPPRFVGKTRPARMYRLLRSPITISRGQEFTIEGLPLRDDPLCNFYSASMFGEPPPTIEIGSTWTFDRTKFTRFCKTCTGRTTVVTLDTAKGVVGLRSRLSSGAKGETDDLIDMTVADGGVIIVETHRYLGADSRAAITDVTRLMNP